MMRHLLAAAAVAIAGLTAGIAPASAYYAGGWSGAPWCAVINLGYDVHWDCSYPSLAACRPNVIAGNRGFCNPNPAYNSAYVERVEPHRRARRHWRHVRRP